MKWWRAFFYLLFTFCKDFYLLLTSTTADWLAQIYTNARYNPTVVLYLEQERLGDQLYQTVLLVARVLLKAVAFSIS